MDSGLQVNHQKKMQSIFNSWEQILEEVEEEWDKPFLIMLVVKKIDQ